jgi:hypothetical protein
MSPIRIKDARRQLDRMGLVCREGGKHRVYTCPRRPELRLTLPHRGSGSRPTLSVGLTHAFHKFVEQVGS